jgi:urease accessory protein
MLQLREKVEGPPAEASGGAACASLTLSLADRRKSRLRTRLDDGREATLLLPRGIALRDGDRLLDPQAQTMVIVKAAPEALSVACAADQRLLTRAAYHLGNRHVLVQLGSDWLAYEHDHVLDGMVRALGLTVTAERRPFEPETGGYSHAHHEGPAHAHPASESQHGH